MKTIFAKINQAGLKGLEDPLNYRRVLFINNLSLISSIVSLSVSVLVFLEDLFPQYVYTFIGGICFLGILYLNRQHYYILARSSFLILSVVIITGATYAAYQQGRFNEAENILIGFMAVNYLLYDSKLRYIGFLLIYGVLIWLKFLKQQFIGAPYDLNFYLIIQNVSILCLTIFFFIEAFRKSLLKAFVRLKEKDELLYLMIDNVPLFIGLIDRELRYRMVNINYERSFGKKREEIIGSRVEEVLPENILKIHMPLIKRSLKGESPEFLEHTQMPDGSTFYATGKYVPVRDTDGEIVGVSAFVSDVTKLEEAKNELKAANSTKDKLFSIIAHDIRGPLDLFEGLLNISSEGSIPQKDFFKYQENVKEKLSGLRETVNSLLEWARTQLDGINTIPGATSIEEVVNSNLNLYKELIDQKKIKVKTEIQPDLNAWVDRNHLKIGIRNIIHNSLKFTEKNGELTIKGFRDGGKSVIVIEDTGVGMDEAKVASIRKKELQHSKSGTLGEGGTGLGLSLSLELLEKNNCEVVIDSQLGHGTKLQLSMQAYEKAHEIEKSGLV